MPALIPITVIKRNLRGEETFRYTGNVLDHESNRITLEARFNRSDLPFMRTVLRHGDRFIETYFMDRWYNIFEIHDVDDDQLKGWYCNLSRPAVMEGEGCLSYVDLALDLWVSPDGTQTVLDLDEFEELGLDEETQRQVQAALAELKTLFLDMKKPGYTPV